MKKHLAIFAPEVVKHIFSGKKNIETRFSKKRIPPFGVLNVGDLVYIKPAGEEIKGQFLVTKVIFFEGIDEQDWVFIKKHYGKSMSMGTDLGDEKYFAGKLTAHFGTLIFIDRVEQFLTPPIKFKKKDQRGWMVLD